MKRAKFTPPYKARRKEKEADALLVAAMREMGKRLLAPFSLGCGASRQESQQLCDLLSVPPQARVQPELSEPLTSVLGYPLPESMQGMPLPTPVSPVCTQEPLAGRLASGICTQAHEQSPGMAIRGE